jgi:cytochrome P450
MFAAGTDTTYLILEFAMAELMLHQDIMSKLQDEVRSTRLCQEAISEDNLSRMTYLKAIIKETLRLHPPAPLLIPHLSLEDCDVVDNFKVPAGTTVLVNVWAIGRDPRTWDNAEEFMPERFIHDGQIGGVDFRGKDFRYLPFGSGRRMCPGMNFALATIEIMLANLVYHFDWELPKGADKIDMTEVFGLTARRKEKLLLVPSARDTVCPSKG